MPRASGRQRPEQFIIVHLGVPTWASEVWGDEGGAAAAAAAAKSLQSCPTLCDPVDGSPPSPLSLGLSRQEYWSGLPFPSPMHESEK